MSIKGSSILFLFCFTPLHFSNVIYPTFYKTNEAVHRINSWQGASHPSQYEEPPGTIPEPPESNIEPVDLEQITSATNGIIPQNEEINIIEEDSLLNETPDTGETLQILPETDDLIFEQTELIDSHKASDVEMAPEDSIVSQELAVSNQFEEFILKIDADSAPSIFDSIFEKYSIQISNEIPVLGTRLLKIDSVQSTDFLNEINGIGGFEFIEKNSNVLSMLEIPNDPMLSLQYGLDAINAPEGWSLKKSSTTVTIAVLDTGVDLDHPDLVGSLVAGFNVFLGNDDPQDDNGHGTRVAGICAAVTDNGLGIAGASWGASIMPVKVLDASGRGSFQNAADGIIWAVDNGAQVINLSLGGPDPSLLLEDAIKYAIENGVVVVAASGNTGTNFVNYPARYEPVIAVGATGENNQIAGFSNFGPELDVVAPGMSIYTTLNTGTYGYFSGTSAATPFTSALSAILLSVNGNASNNISQQICASSLDLGEPGKDEYYGCGLIQMDKALGLVVDNTPPAEHNNNQVYVPIVNFVSEPLQEKFSPELNMDPPNGFPFRFQKIEEKVQKYLTLSENGLLKGILLESETNSMEDPGFISTPMVLLVFILFLIFALIYLKNRAGAK